MRIAQHHLNPRVSEHRGERNQVDPSHSCAGGPRVAKIVESESQNRTLVCFSSDAIDSRQCADVRAIHFDDWLVVRATGKKKIAFHFLKPSSQDRASLLGERG